MYLLKNKSKRIYCIGDKDVIPGAYPVEITESEANHPILKAHIEAGDLELEVKESVPAGPSLEEMDLKQLKIYAAEKDIDITGAGKTKDEILAVIKAAEAGQ